MSLLGSQALIILCLDCDLETYLAENALTCEQFCPKAYDKPDHGEASVPCLGKVNEAESGCCLIGHGSMKSEFVVLCVEAFDQPATAEMLCGAFGKLVGIGSGFPSARALARIYI